MIEAWLGLVESDLDPSSDGSLSVLTGHMAGPGSDRLGAAGRGWAGVPEWERIVHGFARGLSGAIQHH